MAYRKRKKRLEGKYIVRRTFLLLLTLTVVGGGVWAVAGGYLQQFLELTAEAEAPDKEPGNAEVAPAPAAASTRQDRAMEEADKDPVPAAKPAEEESSREESSQQEEKPVVQKPSELDQWYLILVNKNNPLPTGFEVELKTVVDEFRVDTRISEPLLKMMAAAREDGISLLICSAYRDEQKQATNLENYKNRLMTEQGMSEEEAAVAASLEIADPGTSEHHTGLAVDIVTPNYQTLNAGFENTPAFGWLAEHAAEYGFVLRYPKNKVETTQITYEPWHYRYVGVEHAKAIKESGYCLEEYVQALKKAEKAAAVAAEDDTVDKTE